MKRIIPCTAAVLVAAASLTGAAVTTHAAAPMTAGYSGTLLAPRNGSKVAGAVAMIASGGQITVAITAAGLKPNTRHTVRVNQGACGGSLRDSMIHLPQLVADTMGEAHAGVVLPMRSLPAAGYSVTIHDANPALTVLSCGNLHHPTMVVDVRPVIGATVHGTVMMTEPAPVMGNKVMQGTEVIEYATGMTPGYVYPTHIHAGVCGTPAPVQYSLLDLVPDAKGAALSGSGITDMAPMSGVSVHIHAPSWAMVACGNVGSPTPTM